MNPIFRNIISVIAGWVGGSLVNMGLVKIGHSVFPISGVDPNDIDALANAMSNLGFEYFIFPFLAHALGTLVGAVIAGLIAKSHKMKFSLVIGALFLIGGIIVNIMIPGPVLFALIDVLFAYLPMAWIGGKLAVKMSKSK